MPQSNDRPVRNGPTVLKVLDVGTQVAGPFAATLLGDMGAEVIKCEEPKSGDPVRYPDGKNPRWQSEGRNKRSITVNLRTEPGQALVRRLATEWADILIENYRPGTMKRWNLHYASLSAANPRLVYVSVSGYGQTGPLGTRPSYDPIAAAFGGLMFASRNEAGEPVLPGLHIADHMTGMFAALGALEAVRTRDSVGGTGRGSFVDVSLLDSLLRLGGNETVGLSLRGTLPMRPIYPPFRARDGVWVIICPVQPKQFFSLAKLTGDPKLSDERFADRAVRVAHQDEINASVRRWIATEDSSMVLRLLEESDVPAGPVNTPADLMKDPQVRARGALTQIVNADGQTVTMPSPTPRFSDRPNIIRWAGQHIGQSNDDIYAGLLGLSKLEIDTLKEQGVI